MARAQEKMRQAQENIEHKLAAMRNKFEAKVTDEEPARRLPHWRHVSGIAHRRHEAAWLAALSESRKPPRRQPGVRKSESNAHWLRVRISDIATGKPQATVNLPLGMVDAGLNIAAQYAPEIAFDELVETIEAGVKGKIIDVFDEEEGKHIEIFIE